MSVKDIYEDRKNVWIPDADRRTERYQRKRSIGRKGVRPHRDR